MANESQYLFNFTGNGSQTFTFPADVTLIIATGTWGTAQVDIGVFDRLLNDYQTIDSWTVATLPPRGEARIPAGTLGKITVSVTAGTNLNITIKPGSVD